MSWFGNSIVLFVLYRQRASLLPTDYLTYNLAVSDASISVFGYSRGIIEIFNVFQDSGYLISSIWTCQVLTSQLRLSLWWDVTGSPVTCSHAGGRVLHAGVRSEQHLHADRDQHHTLHQRMPPKPRSEVRPSGVRHHSVNMLLPCYLSECVCFSALHHQDQCVRVSVAHLDRSWILVRGAAARLGQLHRQEYPDL